MEIGRKEERKEKLIFFKDRRISRRKRQKKKDLKTILGYLFFQPSNVKNKNKLNKRNPRK